MERNLQQSEGSFLCASTFGIQVGWVPREQAQQQTAEKMAEYRRRQTKTGVCSVQWSWPLENCPSGADFFGVRDKISRDCLLCGFQLWRHWLILQGVERRKHEAWLWGDATETASTVES